MGLPHCIVFRIRLWVISSQQSAIGKTNPFCYLILTGLIAVFSCTFWGVLLACSHRRRRVWRDPSFTCLHRLVYRIQFLLLTSVSHSAEEILMHFVNSRRSRTTKPFIEHTGKQSDDDNHNSQMKESPVVLLVLQCFSYFLNKKGIVHKSN